MKRTKKSLRKIKLLVLLMLITVILLITATYAWFSTQRDVEITGMRLNIEVAESLQISLDGETWLQSIEIEDMKQFYGTYTGNSSAHQAVKITDGTNLNYVPKELLPVSSDGTVAEGKLQFVKGTILGAALTEITACSEDDITEEATIGEREEGNDSHPYLVFDMYLRNISAKQDGEVDILKLNDGSKVWINTSNTTDKEGAGTENTGLEYSARVGMVLYGNSVDVTSTSSTISEDVRTIEPDGNETVAIWEPNNLEHTPYVVSNNGMGITMTSQAITTYAIKSTVTGSVDDIYDTTDTTNLSSVYTMTPTYNNLKETTVEANLTAVDGTTQIGLKPNTMSKVRVYIWLEGQDPDCVDLASTGDKLNVELKLTKDETTSTEDATYVGTGRTIEAETGTVLTANEVEAVDYGEYVTNYTASNATNAELGISGWRIFYSDGNNIYLIADDYINNDYKPAGRNGTNYTDSNGTYKSDLMALSDYTGMSDIDSNLRAKLLRQHVYASEEDNAKATAYLLDTNVWSGFANSTYAEYAIGGPTLELFVASYNKTYKSNSLETRVVNDGYGYGYELKWNNQEWTGDDDDYYISEESETDSLYSIDGYTKAFGMWLASPSAGHSDGVLHVSLASGGLQIWDYETSHMLGLRPIVSLKSNVKIEKQEDGTYLIVE